MIPPLKDTTADDEVMTRRRATIAQINEFYKSGTDALVEKAISNDRSSLTYIKSETLLFFLRESKNRNNQELFNTLYAILFAHGVASKTLLACFHEFFRLIKP